ncbi:hypothetical protein OSTOST_25421 [Ostertagia ostertagi]
MTASVPPIENESEENEREREKKWNRKSLDEHKTKRRETSTSFSSFLHRFTRSEDKKEDKQKISICEEETLHRPDKLPLPDIEENWYEMKHMGMDGFRTALEIEESLLTEFVPARKELIRVEHSDPDLDDLERSMLKLLEEFRSGQMRSLTDEQMESMRKMKKEHEDVTNLHLALYNLDKTGSKLFTDMPNIEGLLKIINEIPEGDEGAPEKVAEIARKYKDVFEKKPGEVEHFLTNCNPRIGSAAMMVAIKALYDSSIAKNNEQVFPLARNAVNYCLRKKNEAAPSTILDYDAQFEIMKHCSNVFAKLLAEVSISEGVVRLEVVPEKINNHDVVSKLERLNVLRQEMERMDAVAQLHPALLQRCMKTTALLPYCFPTNEDEGLGMSSSPLEYYDISETGCLNTRLKSLPSPTVEIFVQTATLVKIAAGGFLVGSTALYLAQKSVQRKVRNFLHYIKVWKSSLNMTVQNSKDALGPPIKVGSVDLADRRHNFVGKTTSMLRIPVTGTISGGYMDVMAVRDDESKPFVTAKIRLILDDAAISIYDTGTWKDSGVEKASDS